MYALFFVSKRYTYIFGDFLIQQHKYRQASTKSKAPSFRNFACIDAKNNKFYLNLQDLAIYEIEKISFISAITRKMPGQNSIDISPQPILVHNDISYFLLLTSCCSPEILKLLYMLSHSIYITVDMLHQLQLNIGKAIDHALSWNIRNYLYIVVQDGSGHSEYFSTAESKQYQGMNAFQFKDRKNKIVYDRKLQMFFTKIEKTLITDESPSDLQSLAKSSLLELGESSMFYTYESILKGCTRLLASNKPLPIRQFYDLNTNIATRKLLEEALNNFGSFLNSYLEEGGVVSLKDIKSVLSNAKQASISILTKNEKGWLGEEAEFKKIMKELIQKIDSETKEIMQTIISRNKEYAYRVLYNQKGSKLKKLMGNEEIQHIQISFQAYASIIKNQIKDLILEIKENRKEMDEGKLINNSEDFLRNLEIRIGIYQQKKNSCEGAIQLAKEEQNYLKQLVYGLKIKLQPFDVITN